MMKTTTVFFALALMTFILSCHDPASPEIPIQDKEEDEGYADLVVYSEPWHAYIYIDGLDTGKRTNDEFQVKPGSHTIKILKEGFRDWETTIIATAKNIGQDYIGVLAKLQPVLIIVTNPTADTIWAKGEKVEITWEAQNTMGVNRKKMKSLYLPYVKLYLYKGGSEILTIVSELENNGSYTWTVDPSLVDGTDYKIRVNAAPEKPNIKKIHGMSEKFTIRESR